METFKFDGLDYPMDSIYAQVMCKYMFPPSFSSYSKELWNNTRDKAIQDNLTVEQLEHKLGAKFQ